ncbi:MAG: 50S ribosomal protein L9 [Candidatus Spechtbacteria bacterium RIFCSPLOWO2_01_FULL_46_10]|uniref:Large ribosomal subunit protein bL9 n=1 Tax=Candidatus Spechtbacteria bacterium RIFCSPLOWO2_01_FULL_46_10 TaxID=1802163 RepID=A0A1G2HH87_9BACT|nr:MAG: 50S ribosomal protein L9 [Candidatus Spechtbacteria bacterium RIFCSPLOWO2_01_FULL_46_10]
MKVILLKSVKNLGRQWEVRRVSDGYARNFLLPRGLVKLATQNALKELDELQRRQEKDAVHELQSMEELVAILDGFEFIMRANADDNGNLYAQIGAKDIVSRFQELEFKVPANAVKLKKPIKTVGEHKITLEFDHGLEAEVKVEVEADNQNKK